MEHVIEGLASVDWDDAEEVASAGSECLAALVGKPGVLASAVAAISDQPHLLALSEHQKVIDKLVLHDDKDSGVRVRLHIFLPGYFDRPHNHRWSFASRILRGSYRHYLFEDDRNFDEQTPPTGLKPRMVRHEGAGSTYALHHSMIHAVVAEPYTVSLVLRGPSVKDRYLATDRVENRTWWEYGAAKESPEVAAAKRMSAERLRSVQGQLAELGAFER